MTKIFLVVFLAAFSLLAEVWHSENEWSLVWENNYSDWVKESWVQEIFTDEESLLYGLKTDCADATYFMRAYFSYKNKLPFVATSSSGKLLTEKSKQFDFLLDENKKVISFLKYLADVTNTYTLAKDTFPIPMNRKALKAGAIYLSPGIHSYQIVDLDEYGNVTTLSSTVPRDVRILFKNYGFPFYIPKDIKNEKDGFRVFKWPSEYAMSDKENLRRSSEQYELFKPYRESFVQYNDFIIDRLKLKAEPLENKINRVYESLCYYSRERSAQVTQAYVQWLETQKTCLSRSDYDEYSTFFRDDQLKEYFNYFRSIRSNESWPSLSSEAKEKFLSVFNQKYARAGCLVETTWPRQPVITLFEIREALEKGLIVSDPNADIAQRWGLKSFEPKCLRYETMP